MQVPEKLINFRVYKDGTDLIGLADVSMPSFDAVTDTVKGAGLAGEIDSPAIGHFKSMEVQLNWRTVTKDNSFLAKPESVNLDLRGAQQVYDSSTGKYVTSKLKVVIRGVPKKFELGKLDMGASVGSSNTLEVNYIKVSLDGKEVIELDKFNYIYKVDGEDWMADVREALGLA